MHFVCKSLTVNELQRRAGAAAITRLVSTSYDFCLCVLDAAHPTAQHLREADKANDDC